MNVSLTHYGIYIDCIFDRYLLDKDAECKYAGIMALYYSETAHRQNQDKALTPQPLYWSDADDNGDNANNGVTFNTALLSELPTAIRRGPWGLRHLYRDTLANPTFITAACAAGLARELLVDLTGATTQAGPQAASLRTLLTHYSRFFKQNVHVLEQDPALFMQQVWNSPNIPEDLRDHLQCYTLHTILPWVHSTSSSIALHCQLMNKSEGEPPCFMTSQGQEVTGDIYGLDAVGINSGDQGYVVIGSTHESKAYGSKNRWNGKIDVINSGSLQCVASVPCDHAVTAVKVLHLPSGGRKESDLCVVYSSMDRDVRTVIVTGLGACGGPTASHGVTLSLETPLLGAKFIANRRPPHGPVSAFAVTPSGRLVASSYGHIASRAKFYKCTDPQYKPKIKRNLERKFFHSILRMWDLSSAHEQWSHDRECAVQPLLELDPVLAEVVEPDAEPSQKNQSAEGYYVVAMIFTPDAKYLILALLTEDDGDTLSPFLSVRDATTLETVWTMNNVIGFNILSNLENDLKYWLSCIHGDSPDTWFVALASVLLVTCVALYIPSSGAGRVQGRRVWGVWKKGKFQETALCNITLGNRDVNNASDASVGTVKRIKRVLISHPDKRMIMHFFPGDGTNANGDYSGDGVTDLDLGDPSTWNEQERASEAAALGRTRVFNPYHTPVPASLTPPDPTPFPLPDLGAEIQRMWVDNANPENAGLAVTVSKSGEVKITDLNRYLSYKGKTVKNVCLLLSAHIV